MNFSEKIKEYLKSNKNKTVNNGKSGDLVSETVKTTSNSKASDRENLIDKIKDYNKESDRIKSVPDLTFEEKTYTPKTDDEINEEVGNEINYRYDEGLKSLDSEKEEKINNYLSKKQSKEDAAKQTKANISENYSNLTQAVSNDAITRGLQRSSIVSEQVKELEKDELEKLFAVDEKLAKSLEEIDKQITDAENEYISAVSELNFNKALETKEKVDKLKEQEEKKLLEVVEYNNKMRQEAVETNKVLNTEKADELTKVKRNIVGAVMQYIYSFPESQRYEKFINDTELIELLGENADYIKRYLKTS